jgi:hypothetical protein
VSGLSGGGHYVIRVGPNTALGSPAAGNFALAAQFGTSAAQLSSLASDTVAPDGSRSFDLFVAQSQLMHLVLSATPVAGIGTVELSLLDPSGHVEFRLSVGAGDIGSGAALFLLPGAHTLQFTATGPAGSLLAFDLKGEGVSDPIGTVLSDPTLKPIYPSPLGPPWFQYPIGVTTTSPILIAPINKSLTTPPPTVVTLSVTSSASLIDVGGSVQFHATGIRSDGSTVDLTSQVSWTPSLAGIVGVTSTGLATALATGRLAITAGFEGLVASTMLTVAEPGLVSVISVSPVFNGRHLVTQLRVALSGSADRKSAQTLGIYRLTTLGQPGRSTARGTGPIALRGATYDATNRVVTLTLRKPVAMSRPFQLLIKGAAPRGLKDTLGRFIDGDRNGLAGGDAAVIV